MNAAELLAVLTALVTDNTHADNASDGPPEQVIPAADLDWLADRAADREERFREGA